MRVRGEGRPNKERSPLTGWEAVLVERLRSLPRERAPARLRRRILAALDALERGGERR
jgi:hypothetical protein